MFIPAARELSSAIFLVGPNTRVISVMLFDLSEEGNFEVLAALGMARIGKTRASPASWKARPGALPRIPPTRS